MEVLSIAENFALVQAEIDAACQRAGRSPDSVTLVAVSKTHTAQRVAEAVTAGLRHFGENRLEEAASKIPAVAALTGLPLFWHMIGHVQGRKVRYLSADFAMLHSLDSLKLAERISRAMTEQHQTLNVLLEINVSGEATKEGWDAYNWRDDTALRQSLWDDISQVLGLPGLQVQGLMTMAPIVEHAELARPVFTALRELREALANDFPQGDWQHLSMGMSDDYPVAIEEGATLVRIGRALFGARRVNV